MPVHSFFIFDRHTECIYQRRWHEPTAAAPTTEPKAVASIVPAADAVAESSAPAAVPTASGALQRPRRTEQTIRSDDAKLLFGVIFSLRGIVRRLGGPDDEFISYNTGQYKLHYYETPTSLKFCMMTDLQTGNMRVVLHQIWVNLYVEYVVRNPLSPVEHPGGLGVGNELFQMGLDRFVSQVFNPA